MKFRLLACALSVFLPFAAARAQAPEMEPVPDRAPTERALLFGIGRTNQLDTYLSPMEYRGMQVSIMASRERMTRMAGGNISFQSIFHGAFSTTENPAHTADCLGGRVAYSAGWHYNHTVLPGLRVKGGGLIGADAGFLYIARNGNNPAQGKAGTQLSLSVGTDYSFTVKKLPLRFAYQADMPMLGVMFCPEFGESYYGISQDGVGHDIICSHPGNALCLRQLLSADFRMKRFDLRIAYLCDIRQSSARSLKYHDISHSFMFGVVRRFQLMRTKVK